MARWTERRTRFRSVMAGNICVSPASVYDAMTGRMAADLGYEIGILAGSVASMTVLGAPDLILLTLSEFADQARRIGRASELPLLVDADHGYGNALNVMRTVEELEAAGVSALSIEDTDLPVSFDAPATAEILSLEEGLGKMRAAVAAKPDPDLVIAGRTSAPQITGMADCCARVAAYSEAGVDAIFLIGMPDKAALDMVAAVTDLPIILGGPGPELKDPDYLASKGVRILLTGHQPIAAAISAAYQTLKAIREGVPVKDLPGLPDKELVAAVLRDAQHKAWTRDFLES